MTMGACPKLVRSEAEHLTPTAVRELLDRQSALIRLTVHELRRPLTVAQGHLSMVADGTFGSLPEETDPSLQAMASAVQEMSALVDGLAAVARHEDGAAQLVWRRSSIQRIMAGAIAAVDTEARDERVVIKAHGPDVEVDVDPHHLRIAMVNLLANAIHHSRAGSVVTLSVAEAERQVRIAITDRGPASLLARRVGCSSPGTRAGRRPKGWAWVCGSYAASSTGTGAW